MKFNSIFSSFLLSYFFSISCCEPKLQLEKKTEIDSIKAIKVLSSFPIIDNETGKLTGQEPQEAYIFQYRDLILQKEPYTFTFYGLPDSGNVLKIDSVQIRHNYFIYKKGDPFGYLTDSSRNLFFLKCPIDSINARFWATVPFIEPLLENFHYEVVDSLTRQTDEYYSQTYFFQNKEEPLQVGTFTTEFSDSFPVVDYSISRRLDTVKGMKLVHLNIFNKSRYSKKYNLTIDEVDQNQRIELFKDFKKSEIAPFFEYMKMKSAKN